MVCREIDISFSEDKNVAAFIMSVRKCTYKISTRKAAILHTNRLK